MGCGAILIGHTNYQVPFAGQILPLPSSFILDISAKDNASPHPNGGESGRQKRARLYPVHNNRNFGRGDTTAAFGGKLNHKRTPRFQHPRFRILQTGMRLGFMCSVLRS